MERRNKRHLFRLYFFLKKVLLLSCIVTTDPGSLAVLRIVALIFNIVAVFIDRVRHSYFRLVLPYHYYHCFLSIPLVIMSISTAFTRVIELLAGARDKCDRRQYACFPRLFSTLVFHALETPKEVPSQYLRQQKSIDWCEEAKCAAEESISAFKKCFGTMAAFFRGAPRCATAANRNLEKGKSESIWTV